MYFRKKDKENPHRISSGDKTLFESYIYIRNRFCFFLWGKVKPLTTKVASFPSPFRGRDCLSEIQRCPQYPAAYAASTAARLIRSDKVQVLLFRHRGTFAPMSCCTVTGTDFKISRMKYRDPIL